MSDQVHGNLGGEPSSFVGRTAELAELRRLAAGSRALTLCGAGGIGKTRLALRLLAVLAPGYPDGTWFVDLSDLREPDLVVSRIASVIGVAEEPGRLLLDTLADALRPRQVLLGLDNCEHLIGACAQACERLLAAAPGLQVVATSRERLRVAAETVWPVPPLSLPGDDADPVALAGSDAVRLFTARASAVSPDFALGPGNARAVASICRMLDGLPLAIELAAAWVRVLSAEQIADRLDDRFSLLVGGERIAPPRQRALRSAIDWSYDLLSDPERVLLRRLSVFAGWSLEMAEQVCADDILPAGQVFGLLAALADKSLVVADIEAAGPARYRMLDSIRQYAAGQLAAAGEATQLCGRLRDYVVSYAEQSLMMGMARMPAPWSDRVEVFRRFDVDADNMREALAYCLAGSDAETGLRICTGVLPCWVVRGLFAEGIEWFDRFLALDVPVPDTILGPALIGRAQIALSGNFADAEAHAVRGLEVCWSAGEEFSIAAALNLLTEAAVHAGRIELAAARADEALAVARNSGDRWNEAYALATQATVAGHRRDPAQAEQLGGAALAIMREIDQQWGAARALLGLGDLARLTGDGAAARQRYQEALAILREVDARPEIARCLAGLGRIALAEGDLPAARQRLAESMRLSRAIGSRIGVIRGLEAFAALALQEQQPGRALLLAAAAAACRREAALPAPAERIQRYLDAAAGLGHEEVARLRAGGGALGSGAATALALAGTAPADAAGDPVPEPEAAGRGARDDFLAADARAAGFPGEGTWAPADAGASAGAAACGANGTSGELTPRELEVAAIIADGKSNKEIAAQLYISPATAARHVANILRKLGFSSRVQIATWAREIGVSPPRTER
ncbi:MAG: LuxR C-terminal-related transcriptional regulator [Streptosporangiaceae bacterium]